MSLSIPPFLSENLPKCCFSSLRCCKCGEVCKGEVLRVQNSHFHIKCFKCKVCGCDLAQGGFFVKNGDYLCTLDYQQLHGTRCSTCGQFVEGEVVTALGKTYHPSCFICSFYCLCQDCAKPMSPGATKTISGRSSEWLNTHYVCVVTGVFNVG
uniref:LIM zinc-binding domain-containing protein n=1 Tax=Electrophorus electricus TaxID=8005 RepID=A0A4W4GS92_ELEEL